MARLSVIEQSNNEKPKEDKPKEEPKQETEVETVDEIEKLLNS